MLCRFRVSQTALVFSSNSYLATTDIRERVDGLVKGVVLISDLAIAGIRERVDRLNEGRNKYIKRGTFTRESITAMLILILQ